MFNLVFSSPVTHAKKYKEMYEKRKDPQNYKKQPNYTNSANLIYVKYHSAFMRSCHTTASRIYRKADFIADEIGFLYYALKVSSQTKIISF